MTFMWLWLSRFWLQQLHGGQAWTTAGRLIGPARHMGFVVAVLALAVAARLAVWPKWPPGGADGPTGLGGWPGVACMVLLIVVLLNRALAARSLGLGAFAVVAVVIGGAYSWLRL